MSIYCNRSLRIGAAVLSGVLSSVAVAEEGALPATEALSPSEPRSTEIFPGVAPGVTADIVFDLPADPESLELKERVEGRWQALIDRDFAAAYEYESPEFRKSYSPEKYMNQFGPQVRWHMATVRRISYDQRGTAEVLVEIDHDFFLPSGDRPVRSKAYFRESWVYIDGHWWRNATQKEFELPGS